jgi:hypothetical protein
MPSANQTKLSKAQASMPSNALRGFLVPISTIVERPVEREPPRTWVKCTRANCTSPRFVQRADPDDTTCVACKKRDREYNNSKAGKEAKQRYEDARPGDKAARTKKSEEKHGKDNHNKRTKKSEDKLGPENHAKRRKKSDAKLGKEHVNERNRRSDAKLGKEHVNERNRQWKKKNPEKIKESMDVWNKSDAAKECKAAYKLTDKGIAAEERYNRSAARRASRLRERQNGKKLEANARYRANHRAELKAKQKIWNHSPMGLLARALCKMVKGTHWDPQSFPKLGSFATNEEARAHFEERFEPWMSWENQGAHVKGNAYDATWNIGHALPRKIFDESNEEDLRRCWSPDNLFPQCARQNTELRDALIYTDAELLEMRHLWPVGANDDLEQLKGLFQFVDHDFINSKMANEYESEDAAASSGDASASD